MLELPNFGRMNASTIQFQLCYKILLVTSSTEIVTSKPLFQNTFILKRPGEAVFADIIKIITRFIKKVFKDSRKIKRIKNYVSKYNLYLYFFI